MKKFVECYDRSQMILTEGAIGLRVSNEFGIIPDRNIMNASLIYSNEGQKVLETIYGQYLQIACDFSLPIILMTNTRRTNKQTVENSPYKDKEVIRDYAVFLKEIMSKYSCESYIGGIIGCKGNAYTGEGKLSRSEAYDFHSWQIEKFVQTDIDLIFCAIMPTLDEIIGMSNAIETTNLPYIVSLMIKENGNIIDGHNISEVIKTVDIETERSPLCYMTNCVHPKILINALKKNQTDLVKNRFAGIQANAAYMTPEDLDMPSETKTSDPVDLATYMSDLYKNYGLKIFGGCCGTDQSHLKSIAEKLYRL